MESLTEILHGIPVDALTGAISVPIYQTSTFVQEAPGEHKGYDYSRTNNPTRHALENLLSQLEGGSGACAFASGMAAIDAVIKLLKSGDEIIAVNDIYGGAFRLFTHIYEKFGIKVVYVDTTDLAAFEKCFTPHTQLVWLESPTNPTLKISDIQSIANITHKYNSLLCVDNTFASPVAQKPLKLGADLVIHSATKYLAGHSDVIAGAVVASTTELFDKIKFVQNAGGAILGPWDSWLTIRGIETLSLRYIQHSQSAQAIAEYLSKSPFVNNVYYPGLSTHTNHQVACKQMSYFGGVISFDLKQDNLENAHRFVSSTKYFKLAESLGGVKSLICHPAAMTHKSIPSEIRQKSGVTDSLIRLSVGLEDVRDLIEDIEEAFNKYTRGK